MNKPALIDFYKHMEWADATVWRAALTLENARTDVKLREAFHHLHLVQRAFLRVWRDEPRDAPYPTFEDTAALRQWGQTYYAEADAQLAAWNEAQIVEKMNVPWAAIVEKQLGRAPEANTLGETAMQVVFHTLYHRGQINARLRELGGTPPLVDYIAWVWLGRPAAEWPSFDA